MYQGFRDTFQKCKQPLDDSPNMLYEQILSLLLGSIKYARLSYDYIVKRDVKMQKDSHHLPVQFVACYALQSLHLNFPTVDGTHFQTVWNWINKAVSNWIFSQCIIEWKFSIRWLNTYISPLRCNGSKYCVNKLRNSNTNSFSFSISSDINCWR